VYGIAEQSGGAIAVDSAPGRGTTVAVFLPRELGGAGDDREATEPTPS
jgi:signal transduction histidine kinase